MADELDRMFELLVRALAREARLAVPFPAAEVHERLVPYRSNRSRLKVATHQDYEMAILRLLAGERGYARLEPEDVREAMEHEVNSPNPDPAYFRSFPDALLMVNGRAAERVLTADQRYAPPTLVREEPEPEEQEPATPPSPFALAEQTESARCEYCGGALPSGRALRFCPHCGQPQAGDLRCPACSAEVDVGWAYCVSCGRATGFE